MRVLALQLKRIGDLVLTTPALHALRSAGAHVTLALMDTTAALRPLLGACVDETLVYRTRGGDNAALWRQVWRERYEACVDFTGRDRSALLTLLSRASRRVTADALLRGGGWRRWCYNAVAPAPVRSRHTVDHYLEYLAPLGIAVPTGEAAASPVLSLPPATVTEADALLRAQGIDPGERFAVVHPGTARTEKYWQADRWAEVVAHCQQTLGLRCVLTGGRHDPEEQAHLAALRTALATQGQKPADLAGQLDLPVLAAVLARAGLVLGVDSGPMHLAAAFRCPQIVLFGPTNPFHWRPRHPAAHVLRAGHGDRPLREFVERSPGAALDQISTAAVIQCIEGATKGA